MNLNRQDRCAKKWTMDYVLDYISLLLSNTLFRSESVCMSFCLVVGLRLLESECGEEMKRNTYIKREGNRTLSKQRFVRREERLPTPALIEHSVGFIASHEGR